MRFFLGLFLATSALAQAPVPLIDPRGVVDYYRPTPAPATIARGGILLIQGTNLGPVTPVTAKAGTLPTTLGTPPVEALINGEAMPLYSVSANQIIAQVPYDANAATLDVTVSVGGVTGPPAIVTVVATQPSILTADGSGTGVYSGTLASNVVTLAVTGLGVTKPALLAGELPAAKTGATPMTAVVAYIGGVRATGATTASLTKVGVFDVKLDVPPTAQPGDLIYLVSAGRASNAVVYQPLSAPSLQMQPIPAGSPTIAGLTTPDVSGFFVIPYAAADATGCSAAMWFDMNAVQSGTFSSCLAPPSRTATSPLVLPANSEVAGGFAGPPAGTAPAGVSSTVVIASADDDSVNSVSLAGNASTLAGNVNATFLAAIPGPPAETQTINGITDAVNTVATAGGGGTGAATTLTANVNGLTYIVTTPVAIATGEFGVVVTDDPIVPTQAAYAVVRTDGTVVASQSFPTGWLPLIPTMPSPTGANVLAASHLEAAGQNFYVLVRAAGASQDAFLVFPENASSAPSMSAMPMGWFAASCAGAVRMLASSFHPALVLSGTNVPDTGYSNPCGSGGFLALDLTAQTVTSYPLGMGSQMSVSSLANYNDFMYTTDMSPGRRNTATTIYVLDSATFSEYSIELSAGSVSFSGAQEVAGTNWLLGTVTNQTAGDGGFVQFDLDAGTATVFPIPDGFSAMEMVGTFVATNKVVARGLVQGSRNFQLLVFDLVTGAVSAVQNPDGVASFGPALPVAASAAKQPAPVGNVKANTVAAPAYDAGGDQTGILLVRVP